MAKFDAGSISSIEYDFNGWGIKDKGVVPEPSRKLVNQTIRNVMNTFKELGMEDVKESAEGITEAMNKITDEEMFEQLTEKLGDVVAELCQGKPSKESLEALPYRPFMAFFAFVLSEVMDPEASMPASNNIRNLKRSG